MTTRARPWDLLSLATLGGAAALSALSYARLPARVPIHFDAAGRANGFLDKPAGAFLLPALALLTWLLVRFGARLSPPGARERLEASPMAAIGALLTALFAAIHVIALWAALHPAVPVGAALGGALGPFWLVLGLVIPRVRRNPLVGVRTAWTLASDENWARTHRFAGAAFVLGGLLAVAAALAGAPIVAISAILTSAMAPVGYSFVLAHRLPPA